MSSHRAWLLALTLVASVATAATAQPAKEYTRYNSKPHVISYQLRAGLEQGTKALELLQAADPAALGRVNAMIRGGYVQVRWAQGGVEMRMAEKPLLAPMLKPQRRAILQAMDDIRHAEIEVQAVQEGERHRLATAEQYLTRALGQINLALELGD